MTGIFIQVDPDRPEPLYRQLEQALLEGITAGSLAAGERLPSSRELAELLRVSRNTVKLCYQELLASGLIVAVERQGMFVGGSLPPEALSPASPQSAPAEVPPGPAIDWPRRLRRTRDAEMAEIAKPAGWSEARYPFLAGQIEPGRFPARAWLRCLREALYKPHLTHSLADDLVGDDPLLVEMIRTKILPGRGVYAEPDEIMITIGSQHGLAMLARMLLSSDSHVLMEDPGYLDARHIFVRAEAQVGFMPVDAEGAVIPDSLAGVDLVSLTPSHHQPTNVTLTLTRRQQVVDRAAAAGTVLVEDDYDSEFRYLGRPSPSLKALDRSGDVIYLGTFSKFLSPGLRIGYMVAPSSVVKALKQERRYTVRHAPGHLQRAMGLFVESGDYQRALRLHRDQMSRKWRAATEAVRRFIPFDCGDFPPGGVSLWITGPEELDVSVLIERAARHGVLLEPGDVCFADGRRRPVFRLGYGAVALRQIEPGIEIIGGLLRQQLTAGSDGP